METARAQTDSVTTLVEGHPFIPLWDPVDNSVSSTTNTVIGLVGTTPDDGGPGGGSSVTVSVAHIIVPNGMHVIDPVSE